MACSRDMKVIHGADRPTADRPVVLIISAFYSNSRQTSRPHNICILQQQPASHYIFFSNHAGPLTVNIPQEKTTVTDTTTQKNCQEQQPNVAVTRTLFSTTIRCCPRSKSLSAACGGRMKRLSPSSHVQPGLSAMSALLVFHFENWSCWVSANSIP